MAKYTIYMGLIKFNIMGYVSMSLKFILYFFLYQAEYMKYTHTWHCW